MCLICVTCPNLLMMLIIFDNICVMPFVFVNIILRLWWHAVIFYKKKKMNKNRNLYYPIYHSSTSFFTLLFYLLSVIQSGVTSWPGENKVKGHVSPNSVSVVISCTLRFLSRKHIQLSCDDLKLIFHLIWILSVPKY